MSNVLGKSIMNWTSLRTYFRRNDSLLCVICVSHVNFVVEKVTGSRGFILRSLSLIRIIYALVKNSFTHLQNEINWHSDCFICMRKL